MSLALSPRLEELERLGSRQLPHGWSVETKHLDDDAVHGWSEPPRITFEYHNALPNTDGYWNSLGNRVEVEYFPEADEFHCDTGVTGIETLTTGSITDVQNYLSKAFDQVARYIEVGRVDFAIGNAPEKQSTTAKRLYTHFGSARDVYEADVDALARVNGISAGGATEIRRTILGS